MNQIAFSSYCTITEMKAVFFAGFLTLTRDGDEFGSGVIFVEAGFFPDRLNYWLL